MWGSGQFRFTVARRALNTKRSASNRQHNLPSCSILQNVAGRSQKYRENCARGALRAAQAQGVPLSGRPPVVVVRLVIWHQKAAAAVVELCFSATLISLTSWHDFSLLLHCGGCARVGFLRRVRPERRAKAFAPFASAPLIYFSGAFIKNSSLIMSLERRMSTFEFRFVQRAFQKRTAVSWLLSGSPHCCYGDNTRSQAAHGMPCVFWALRSGEVSRLIARRWQMPHYEYERLQAAFVLCPMWPLRQQTTVGKNVCVRENVAQIQV